MILDFASIKTTEYKEANVDLTELKNDPSIDAAFAVIKLGHRPSLDLLKAGEFYLLAIPTAQSISLDEPTFRPIVISTSDYPSITGDGIKPLARPPSWLVEPMPPIDGSMNVFRRFTPKNHRWKGLFRQTSCSLAGIYLCILVHESFSKLCWTLYRVVPLIFRLVSTTTLAGSFIGILEIRTMNALRFPRNAFEMRLVWQKHIRWFAYTCWMLALPLFPLHQVAAQFSEEPNGEVVNKPDKPIALKPSKNHRIRTNRYSRDSGRR